MPAGSRLADGSPIGVVTVPAWRPGLAQSVLPSSYRDLLEVLADAGWPLRAGGIAAAAGLGQVQGPAWSLYPVAPPQARLDHPAVQARPTVRRGRIAN